MNGEAVVYVLLPVFNRQRTTLAFLHDLELQDYCNIKVVICDDASSDGTAELVSEAFPEVVLLMGTGNLWWTGGINRCIEYTLDHCRDSDYILTINDDVTLPPNYIGQKVQRAQQHQKTIIGSVCVDRDDPDLIETSGLVMDEEQCKLTPLFPAGARLSNVRTASNTLIKATHLPGKGVLIPVEIFRRHGLYDEQHLPQYHADTEFTYRAFLAGTPVVVDMESIVYSEVNRENIGRQSSNVTIKQLYHSIINPYALNAWRSYYFLAITYHKKQWIKFLLLSYIRIIGGTLLRKLKIR